jgi:hypothetical protein
MSSQFQDFRIAKFAYADCLHREVIAEGNLHSAHGTGALSGISLGAF